MFICCYYYNEILNNTDPTKIYYIQKPTTIRSLMVQNLVPLHNTLAHNSSLTHNVTLAVCNVLPLSSSLVGVCHLAQDGWFLCWLLFF